MDQIPYDIIYQYRNIYDDGYESSWIQVAYDSGRFRMDKEIIRLMMKMGPTLTVLTMRYPFHDYKTEYELLAKCGIED